MTEKKYQVSHSLAVALRDMAQLVVDQKGDWRECADEILVTLNDIVKQTEPEERVIFRRFPHDGTVIALFPDQYNERTGNIGSYMGMGQHAETAPDFGDTKPCEWGDYGNLYRELQRQGYTNLKVVKRFGKLGRKN
jgi:hypothetical protein